MTISRLFFPVFIRLGKREFFFCTLHQRKDKHDESKERKSQGQSQESKKDILADSITDRIRTY
jgi:hypothetical protein